MSKDITTNFLYNTVVGRCILRCLVGRTFTCVSGALLNSPLSKPLINHYIKKYNINMDEYVSEKYNSFNSFFIRNRKEINIDMCPESFIAPCDGFLSVYKIDEGSVYRIKNTNYSISELLKDSKLASEYKNGYCFVFRLAPHNFHRYYFVDSGKVTYEREIDGVYHTVKPIAVSSYPVFIQNHRKYVRLNTTSRA